MIWINQVSNLASATIIVDETQPNDIKRALESVLANASLDAPILRSSKTGERVSLVNAFVYVVNTAGSLFQDVTAASPGKPVQLNVEYDKDDDHFVIDTDARPVRVRYIVFIGLLQIKTTTIPLIEVTGYRNVQTNTSISEVASFAPMDLLGSKTSLQLHRIAETGEIFLGANIAEDNLNES
ncbi:MAG TPA: hypothetical protein VGN17_21735 [Bryobacteraceae bacterium]|jgi:hypothetical protein